MKRMLLLLIVAGFSFAAFSQASNAEKKDSLMKAISSDACKEIVKNKDEIKGDNLEMNLGLIMMGLIADRATELQDAFQFDMANPESMTAFSEQLGMKLAIECPEFLKLLTEKAGGIAPTPEPAKKILALPVTFEKVVPGDITYFQARTSNGKIEKFYWLEYFDGANLLQEKIKPGGKINVQYYEKEVYNSRLKEYVTIKVAVGVSND